MKSVPSDQSAENLDFANQVCKKRNPMWVSQAL